MENNPSTLVLYTLFPDWCDENRSTMCLTHTLFARKMGDEVVAAAFTDHLAMGLRLTVDVPI
jgi:hypothetical protein